MFLDCFKNNGKWYLRVVEGYRVKKDDGKFTMKRRTLKNIGLLEKFDDGMPNVLERLREKFKNGQLKIANFPYDKQNIKNNIVLNIDKNNPPKLEPKNIGYFFLDSLYNSLGIDELLRRIKLDSKIEYDLNGLTKLLTFGRILDPKSKKSTFENKNKYLFDITTSSDINDIYKVLDVLNDKSEAIQKRMNTKIKNSIGRNTDITYYDVTNYYFETMYNDEDLLDVNGNVIHAGLRKKGVSKENRTTPIVQMGLFIDSNGLPISYQLFPGNNLDQTTLRPALESSINKYNLGRIIVVADRGLNSDKNIASILAETNGYVFSRSIKKSYNKYKEWMFDENDYSLTKNKYDEVTFKVKSKIIERKIKDENGVTSTIKEKLVLYWSRNHYLKELKENNKFIEYLEACIEFPDKLKDSQPKLETFIKTYQVDKETGEILDTKAVRKIKQEAVDKYKQTMGYYLIATSEINLTNEDIIDKYHGLSRIEDSFKVIKSDLEGRPVYVWTKEHIKAHFLICFIALTIIRLIQYKVLQIKEKDLSKNWESGITAAKIKESLNGFNVNLLSNDYYQVSPEYANLSLILKALNIEKNLSFPTSTDLRNYKYIVNKLVIY